MQVFRGALDLNIEIAETSQSISKARLLSSQPIIITNADIVNILKKFLKKHIISSPTFSKLPSEIVLKDLFLQNKKKEC